MLALQLYIWYVDGIDMKTTLECMRIIGLNRHYNVTMTYGMGRMHSYS